MIHAANRDPAHFAALAGSVRAGGRAVSVIGGAGEASQIGEVSVSNVGASPAHVAALADLVVRGKLRVAITKVYPLADARQALDDFNAFNAGHTLGKLAIAAI